jgi:hypothetical protein
VQAEARAVQAGATPNLLLNPSFAHDGGWFLRPINWHVRAMIPTLVNAVPTLTNGEARLTAATPEHWSLTQEVFSLAPDSQYRLTLRLRAEKLDGGAVVVTLTPSGGGEPVRHELHGNEAAEWTTVTLEAMPGAPPNDALNDRLQIARTSSLTVSVDLLAEPSSGAVVWCDEATLTLANGSR